MQRNVTLTRAGIAAAVQRQVGLTKRDALLMVEAIIEHIALSLERGDNVKIPNFGTFALRSKARRMGRNPKTGDEHAIEPRRVMTFRPSLSLKARISRADRG